MFTFKKFKDSFEKSFTLNSHSILFEQCMRSNNEDLPSILLRNCDGEIDFYSLKYNHTPLSLAIVECKPAIALQLLAAGANPNIPVLNFRNDEYNDEEYIYPKIQNIIKNKSKILSKYEQFKQQLFLQGKTTLELANDSGLTDVAKELIKLHVDPVSTDNNLYNLAKNSKLLKILNFHYQLEADSDLISEDSSTFIRCLDREIEVIENAIKGNKKLAAINFFTDAHICQNFQEQHSESSLNVLPLELVCEITKCIDFSYIVPE